MKRVLCLSLVLTMICALLTFMPVTAATIVDSGNCGAQGDNVKWTLDSEGTLTISGTGETKDYFGDSPFFSSQNIRKVIIKDGITRIGTWIFRDCSELENIILPDSIISIGEYAFCNCAKLSSINIPNNVTQIGYNILYGTGYYNDSHNWINGILYAKNYLLNADKELITDECIVRNGTKCIADLAFYGCNNLKSITIPNGIKNIGPSTFSDCISLLNVNLPDSIITIGNTAFSECSNLEKINIPNGVVLIGIGAFMDCVSLKTITIPNGVTNINDDLFNNCINLEYISLPKSITNIGDRAFEGCERLLNIDIPANVTNIGEQAFCRCITLTYINIPNSVTNIGDYVFSGCSGLKSIKLPDGITYIGDSVFVDCVGLNSISIPNSIIEIGNSAFDYCDNLKDIYYSGTKQEWKNINIGKWNDPLFNATIHYNSTMPSEATPTPIPTQKPTPIPTVKPTADPNAPSVEITEVSDYIVTAKVNNCNDFDAQVILAVYNKNGALIEMQNYYNFGDVTFFSANLQNANIKVMLWSGTDSIKPLAETAEMSL